jgi:transposase
MLQIAPGVRVYLACRPVDMRRGFDGLSADVAQVLKADPFSGGVFVFRGKRGDYLKILTWGSACSPSGSRTASSCGLRSSMVL